MFRPRLVQDRNGVCGLKANATRLFEVGTVRRLGLQMLQGLLELRHVSAEAGMGQVSKV